MPAVEPINWETIDDALFDWIVGALGFTEEHCDWANQKKPQPPYPYVILLRSGTTEEGTLDETRTSTDPTKPAGQEIELLTTGPREITLALTAHVEPCDTVGLPANDTATALLTKAQSSLGKRSVLDALDAAGVAIIERLPVLDTSVVVNGVWISQAAMDLRLRVTSAMTERTGYIDKLEISSTFGGAKDSLDLDDYLIDAS